MGVNSGATKDDLVKRLTSDDGDSGRVLTLPDGSIDIYYEVREGRGRAAVSRRNFAGWITNSATSSCRLYERERTPGGQSVNTARQSKALGDDVVVFGHLDNPVFESLDMTTRSMGKPAEVNILVFEDGELMLSKVPRDYRAWSIKNLRALPDYSRQVSQADVICIHNWVSFHNMNDVLRELLDEGIDCSTMIFDPGDITESTQHEISQLITVLNDVASEHDVILSLNKEEMQYLFKTIEITDSNLSQQLKQLWSIIGLEAAVVHHKEWALACRSTETLRVPNMSTQHERRTTGAGDRFNGGLAHGLASGWDWETALLLANACASYYVNTRKTGTPESISRFISDQFEGIKS